MATVTCERCGLRPAVASLRRAVPGRGSTTQRLCEVCLAEVRGGAEGYGGTGGFGGRGLFDDFLSDFFERGFGGRAVGDGEGATAAPATRRTGVEQVDITEYFSDATRELLQRAAQKALEWGSLDLDTDHLLWATLQDPLVVHVLREIDADSAAIAAEVEDRADQAERTDVAPSLSPDAKNALLP